MDTFGKILRGCILLLLLMSSPTLKADEVEVFAAASLTDALKEIAADYERPEPRGAKRSAGTKKPKAGSTPSVRDSTPQDCRLKILSLCL